MINDSIPAGMGRSLFADDGALWKRGGNIDHIVRKLQEGIDQVEKWGEEWGFRFSVEKSKVMFFSKKKISENKKLNLYRKNLERVSSFRFLGMILDSRLTWREHVNGIVEKSKGVLNIMRCLAGLEWGADFTSLKYIYIALIRSRIDYGSVGEMDRQQNQYSRN